MLYCNSNSCFHGSSILMEAGHTEQRLSLTSSRRIVLHRTNSATGGGGGGALSVVGLNTADLRALVEAAQYCLVVLFFQIDGASRYG